MHHSTDRKGLARFAFCVAAIAGTILSGCRTHAGEAGGESASEPEVTIVSVRRAAINDELTVAGNLASLPNRDAKLAPLVPGRVARVHVNEGDRVSYGQVLAELDNTALKDQEQQSEAAVAQAKANVENARISAARNEDLLQRGISSRKEVEDARTQFAVNEAALRQAEAALSGARSQLARGIVRAPFSGTVVRRFLGVGDQVDGTANEPILEVADIDQLELLGTVPVSRIHEVKVGNQFSFPSTTVPNTAFPARVDTVLPAVDPATNNGTVRIRIDNRKHLLKLGEFVSVQLPVTAGKDRLVIPRQAIYPDESGEPHVYQLQGDEASFVPVTLGVQTKDQVEILSGLHEGDTVILSGGYGLPEKARVRVKRT